MIGIRFSPTVVSEGAVAILALRVDWPNFTLVISARVKTI